MGAKPPCCPQGLGWYRAIARYQPSISILSTSSECPDRGKYQERKEFLIDPNKYQTCQKFWVSRLLVRMMDGRCRHQTEGRHGAGTRGGNNILRYMVSKNQYYRFQISGGATMFKRPYIGSYLILQKLWKCREISLTVLAVGPWATKLMVCYEFQGRWINTIYINGSSWYMIRFWAFWCQADIL